MTLEEANDRIEELEEALWHIRQWCDAYPIAIFTPLTDGEEKAAVAAAEHAVPSGSTRLHASWARHILDGVKRYTDILEPRS